MKKLISLLFVLLLTLASFTAHAQGYPRGDVNRDGSVNISDVTSLIDYLLRGSWPDNPVPPPDNHMYVDLGLTSGTLWATCNVGASNPEEYGDYFAWGETEPKDIYDLSTYKWCNGSINTLTKYCYESTYGIVDNITELDPEDDAAWMNWGEKWRMPTYDQLIELRTQCTWTWTMRDGVNGRLVTGPNGNSMFLPAAGLREGDSPSSDGSLGFYWSRELSTPHPHYSYRLTFSLNGWEETHTSGRWLGFSVRAVRVSQN